MNEIYNHSSEDMHELPDESVHLVVTSPPYYNAREYASWNTLDDYLNEMRCIIQECFRVLGNHRVCVFNVADIFDNDNRLTKASWGKRRIPLVSYFITTFEDCGFQFVDDFIWDKGEPQSQRNKNGSKPFPLYQYPINCYEHILVFHKHEIDKTRYNCPLCGDDQTNIDGYTGIGIVGWECKNPKCVRSEGNRGKRFSQRTLIMNDLQTPDNVIDDAILSKWRRDIVKIPPVIKTNNKGINTAGHSAPFPMEIPEFAITMFSGVNEIVLDPFMGSGTTAVAAKELGRQYIGYDTSEEYVNLANERLRQEMLF